MIQILDCESNGFVTFGRAMSSMEMKNSHPFGFTEQGNWNGSRNL